MTPVPTYTTQGTTHEVVWPDGVRIVFEAPQCTTRGVYTTKASAYTPKGDPASTGMLRFLDAGDCTRFALRCGAANSITNVDWNARLTFVAHHVSQSLEEAAAARRPDPLRRDTPPPAPYPIAPLGAVLADMVYAMLEGIQAPDAICAQAVLAAATLAVQGHADVTIDGRTYPLSQFFLDVGESGERRSAADRVALQAHVTQQKAWWTRYEGARREYTNELDVWKKERDNILRGQGKGKGKTSATDTRIALTVHGDAPQAPTIPLLIVEEPTYEGIVKLLVRGRPSIGLFSDEGGRFVGGHGMNQDNQLKTVTGLCELWDGKPITRVRATDEIELLYGRRLSLHLMVQPVVALPVLNDPLLLGQGFLWRCMTCWPTSTVGSRPYRQINLETDSRAQIYRTHMTMLLEKELPFAGETGHELAPRLLSLSPRAYRLWVAFHNNVEAQLGEGKRLASIRGWGSKAAEHAARLAGVLTLIDDLTAPEIPHTYMQAGIALAQFYLSEAQRLCDAAGVEPDIVLAEQLLAWAQGHAVISLRQIYQYGPNPIRDAAVAKRIVALLEEHGWVTRVPGGMEIDGAQRRDVWRVNL